MCSEKKMRSNWTQLLLFFFSILLTMSDVWTPADTKRVKEIVRGEYEPPFAKKRTGKDLEHMFSGKSVKQISGKLRHARHAWETFNDKGKNKEGNGLFFILFLLFLSSDFFIRFFLLPPGSIRRK